MGELIPISSYVPFYYHSLMFVVVLTMYYGMIYDLYAQVSRRFALAMGWLLFVFIVFYMGLRPVSWHFGDMRTYNDIYLEAQMGKEIIVNNDYIFNYFMLFCAKIMSAQMFFLVVDIIYIVPMFLFARKYSPGYWYYVFLLFITSFSFWTYGTNGIRNGMATSLFLLALVYYERKPVMYGLFAVAFGFHNSLMIPIAAYFVAAQWKNPKVYLWIWLIAVPLSLVFGSQWERLFMSLGFEDERVTGYLSGVDEEEGFRFTGFRWDFVFYSAFAIFAGWYFIFKKKIQDKFYIHLWGIYVIANAFWILVIRANFSNRFAYLSWFLMAPVIAYPMLKYKLWPDQHKILTTVIFIYYLFTYLVFLRG